MDSPSSSPPLPSLPELLERNKRFITLSSSSNPQEPSGAKEISEADDDDDAQANCLRIKRRLKPPPPRLPLPIERKDTPFEDLPPPRIANPPIKRLSFQIIFCMQLALVAILNIFLIAQGFFLHRRRHDFHPLEWFLPLLAGTWASGLVACAWLWFALRYSEWILGVGFFLSPILSGGLGVMYILIDSGTGRLLGITTICFAVGQVVYTRCVYWRFPDCTRAIEEATRYVPPRIPELIFLAIQAAVLYSSFLVFGICGATAVKTTLDNVFIGVILLSMTWTMHVGKNSINVLVARLKYVQYTMGITFRLWSIVLDLVRHMMGSVIFASALIPLCSLIRGSAQALRVLICDYDGPFCSFITWYAWGATRLHRRVNRWSLVLIGVENMDFITSSIRTWESFRTAQMLDVIDTDLGGVFCFFGGLTGGAVAALVASSMSVAMHSSSYAVELSLYALLIGYFTCRIAMVWPQASLAAYYVGYAENEFNPRVESEVPWRIKQLWMRGGPFRLRQSLLRFTRRLG